ncbi:MAG: hypothetical protein EZS28_031417 [Streblomastix strix]|uniref:Uncharacterized protein n=1 Tax=Streblomastix strix TaxID=222440 RepID=A0A5J4UQV6_9EUKA|nr:MAG: hypothetical protein EZS28_031417 [Streblomastix strix]
MIPFNDDRYDQIGRVIGPIDADRLMYKNIIDSNCTEQDIIPKNNINDAIEYLKNSKVPQIEGLYQMLFKRETFRHCRVYVSDKNNSKIISAANVGIQHENIDPNELQQLVDFVYEYDQSNKYVCARIIENIIQNSICDTGQNGTDIFKLLNILSKLHIHTLPYRYNYGNHFKD